ncbi:hypothetical protein [Salmonirosea aquatica]|uniref:Uncharacterized protein n=1 Tax=Salmonirosea aquatica TaxID=2654236 RepID=A0A7C9FF33_9BACT|nr:hypothetical protein [Cytophagaceae bacterium SJW1-29]
MRVSSLLSIVVLAAMCMSARPLDLLNARGRITLLRTHDVGTKYGPPTDQIDVETVIQLDTKPGMAFGFQLRDDNQRVTREGMLDLLRDAFRNNWPVSIDYIITPPKKNGVIIRVWVEKTPGAVVAPSTN